MSGGGGAQFLLCGETQTPNKHKQHRRNYHKYQISRRETTAAASVTFTAKTPAPKNKQNIWQQSPLCGCLYSGRSRTPPPLLRLKPRLFLAAPIIQTKRDAAPRLQIRNNTLRVPSLPPLDAPFAITARERDVTSRTAASHQRATWGLFGVLSRGWIARISSAKSSGLIFILFYFFNDHATDRLHLNRHRTGVTTDTQRSAAAEKSSPFKNKSEGFSHQTPCLALTPWQEHVSRHTDVPFTLQIFIFNVT